MSTANGSFRAIPAMSGHQPLGVIHPRAKAGSDRRGAKDERGALLRVLGTWFGIAAVIGSVVGVGILRVPAALAADLHQPVLFISIWFVGAAVAVLGANCVAELAVMLPKAGGPYVYI